MIHLGVKNEFMFIILIIITQVVVQVFSNLYVFVVGHSAGASLIPRTRDEEVSDAKESIVCVKLHRMEQLLRRRRNDGWGRADIK